jgi:AraC-like DNA-binding protein
MSERMMVNVAGKMMPLTLDARTRRGPILNSADTEWAGLPFEVHRVGSAEDIGGAWPIDHDRGLFVVLEGKMEFLLRGASGDHRYVASAGAVDVAAGEQPRHILRMSGEGTAVAVHFTQPWLRRLAAEGGLADFGAAATPFVPDETVLELTHAMCSEVSRKAVTGPLFAESLSLALLSYVAHGARPKPIVPRGNLTPEQSRRLRSYIAEHLSEPLSLVELAAIVGLGSRHFSTLFRRTFSLTPHQYVMRERLAEGARMLLAQHADIAEISARVGFCSQSHFTAAFRTVYGVTPRRFVVARASGASQLAAR